MLFRSKHSLSFTFLLASLFSVFGAGLVYFDTEPDYISESLPRYVTLIYIIMLGLAACSRFICRSLTGLFSGIGSGRGGGGGYSGGGGGYSGGGGSSGGGGASGSW